MLDGEDGPDFARPGDGSHCLVRARLRGSPASLARKCPGQRAAWETLRLSAGCLLRRFSAARGAAGGGAQDGSGGPAALNTVRPGYSWPQDAAHAAAGTSEPKTRLALNGKPTLPSLVGVKWEGLARAQGERARFTEGPSAPGHVAP